MALLLTAACQELPALPGQEPTAPIVTVPGTYQLARLTPGHRAHLELKGEKHVQCHDCHVIPDAGFASPGVTSCGSCHEAQLQQHHPLDAGVSLTCLTCHPFRSDVPSARFEQWSCMSCHDKAQGTPDAGGGGTTAISVHVRDCQSCHRPHEKPFTKAAECTTCHDVTLEHGAKGATLADKCMNCHEHHTAAVVASGKCVTCHTKPTMAAQARVSPDALFEKGHVGCGTCHTPHTFTAKAVKACTGCHAKQVVLAAKAHEACTTCHQPHQARSEPKTCESCHRKESLSVKHPPQKGTGQHCQGCHPPHPEAGATLALKNAVGCITCHDTPTFTAAVVHSAKSACVDCHVPHAGKPSLSGSCAGCHQQQLVAVKTNAGHAKCLTCHEGLPHGAPSAPKPCLSCHEKMTPPQKGHPGCATCHESHSAAALKVCVDCHVGPDKPALPGLHVILRHRECKTCHAPHLPQPGTGPAVCRTCHQKLPPKEHPTPPTQCVGCHLFTQPK